jgi:membrane associated rhomboid family serine protease
MRSCNLSSHWLCGLTQSSARIRIDHGVEKSVAFFEVPHASVSLLFIANVVVFGLCLSRSGSAVISADVLFRAGAMYSLAIERHEYWRLLAYGFLHADPFHLATNMFCLVLWGVHLERRVGSAYFLAIYACALATGGIVSNVTHVGSYLAVGASGAISGIMGALLCLWILGKTDLSANFFIINLGLNVALALSNLNIDSSAHLGGFAAGFIACALIDLIERANHVLLRCKFPEFVKLNLLILTSVSTAYLWSGASIAQLGSPRNWWSPVAYVVACTMLIKLIDILLSFKKGLAVVVFMLAMLNAVLVFFVSVSLVPLFISQCAQWHVEPSNWPERALAAACGNLMTMAVIIAACALALTVLAYSHDFDRGIRDVGFIGASMRGERKRRSGI